jgi:hypothetical protein
MCGAVDRGKERVASSCSRGGELREGTRESITTSERARGGAGGKTPQPRPSAARRPRSPPTRYLSTKPSYPLRSNRKATHEFAPLTASKTPWKRFSVRLYRNSGMPGVMRLTNGHDGCVSPNRPFCMFSSNVSRLWLGVGWGRWANAFLFLAIDETGRAKRGVLTRSAPGGRVPRRDPAARGRENAQRGDCVDAREAPPPRTHDAPTTPIFCVASESKNEARPSPNTSFFCTLEAIALTALARTCI